MKARLILLLRRWGIFAVPAWVALLWLGGVLAQRWLERPWDDFSTPNVKVAGEKLLAEKLSGPRYFRFGNGDGEVPFPYITVRQAKEQMKEVMAARHWNGEKAVRLDRLLDRLAEPPPSRMWGEERIHGLQLNLALDEMP